MRWIGILAARIGARRSSKAKGALCEGRQGATADRSVQQEKKTTATATAQTSAPHDDPAANRTVRVFLSSTFLDMQRERDVLVRKAFPALRAHFRPRGVELLEVDLRWGITQEQAESGT